MSYYGNAAASSHYDSYSSSRRNDSYDAYGSGGSFGSKLGELQWDLSKLPVFEKCFYMPHPDVQSRSEREASKWREQHGIVIQGQDTLPSLLKSCR